jgi:hypothetical protein
MPFSKQPVVQTYETKRINLVSNPLQRNSNQNKDLRLLNVMVDIVKSPAGDQKKYYIKSRPGLSFARQPGITGEARGLYYWVVSGVGYSVAVIGNKVYSSSVTTTTLLATLSTSTGYCGFTEFVNSSGVVSLILLDGTNGYQITSPTSAATQITDADFPTPHIPQPVFLDGYLFVAKANSQDIYNSDLDDPTAWTSGNYISAEMYPDTIVGLSKNNNFVYAVGSSSVEYFYDNANATGTPLARQPSAVQQFGSSAMGSIVQTEKEVIFIGETSDGGHTVWTIDGFKETEIGIPAIKSALLQEGSALANGQKLYIINLTNRTLVYSFDTKMWCEWSTNGGTFAGFIGSDGPVGTAYALHPTNGKIYTLDETNFYDDAYPINCSITSEKQDFDAINRKFMHRFSIIGDIPSDPDGSIGTDNSIYISWSDDDYQTWSTPRALDMAADLPSIFQLGSFRRRAFRITYSLPHLFRIEGLEVDINKGSS